MFHDKLNWRAGAAMVNGAPEVQALGATKTSGYLHEMMVAMHQGPSRGPSRPNKTVYIRALVLVMLAASPLPAANPLASSLLTPPADTGRLSVVRVDRRSGKLVRTVSGSASSRRPGGATPPHIQQLVEQSARAHNVDPLLVESVIQVESNFDRYAVSPKGAEGLMQLMPSTARGLGVSNSFDPAENIEAGVKYLRYLQSVYRDDRMALAAYNAGPKAVDKFKGTPPYAETQEYVNRVGQHYQVAKQTEARKNAAQALADVPRMAAASSDAPLGDSERYSKLEQSIDQNGRLVLRTAQE